jgi:hypothetical protein
MTKFYNKLSKNIFYIIFFVLTINTSYSQNTDNWNFKEYDKNIKWNCVSGDCLNGKGVGTYSDTYGRSIKYEGSWKNGLRHGEGRQERNHNTFTGIVGHTQKAQGFFENDLLQKGKIIYSAGITYELSKGKAENFLIEGASAQKLGVSKIESKYQTIDINAPLTVFNFAKNTYHSVKPKEKVKFTDFVMSGYVLKNCDFKIYDNNNKLLTSGKFGEINNRPLFFVVLRPYVNSENSVSFTHYMYTEFEEKIYNSNDSVNKNYPLRSILIYDVTNFNNYKYSYNIIDPVTNSSTKHLASIDFKKKTIINQYESGKSQINKCE